MTVVRAKKYSHHRTSGMPMLALAILVFLTGLGGCSGETFPYNELSEFRVLAIRSTESHLAPDATVTIDSLVFSPDNAPVSRAWSWCPLPRIEGDALACAIDHADLEAMVRRHAGDPTIEVPAYDLGTGESVQFSHVIPAQAAVATCQELVQLGISQPLDRPNCQVGMPFMVTLTASPGTSSSTSITATRELLLLAQTPQASNLNPTILGISAALAESGDEPQTMTEADPLRLTAATDYELTIDIPQASIESYPVAQDSTSPEDGGVVAEQLAVTWFVQGGETEFTRTAYIDGEIGLDVTARNRWTTPDQPGSAEVHIVIRDDRGGLNWLSRTVVIE